MSEEDDAKSKRELLTRLVPYMALSAIKVGIFSSPLNLLYAGAAKYNEEIKRTGERVNDLLPLLSGMESLKLEVVRPNEVSLVMQREDIASCASQYLSRVFIREGSSGARTETHATGALSQFDYVLRLPAKMVYMKLLRELTDEGANRLRETARKLNPAEVWVFADQGMSLDERFEPVFVSENRVLRGRLKSLTTAEMLCEFFERRFTVNIEPGSSESVKVYLKLTA